MSVEELEEYVAYTLLRTPMGYQSHANANGFLSLVKHFLQKTNDTMYAAAYYFDKENNTPITAG